MTLSQELKRLFNDDERSRQMMHGECRYDPNNTHQRFNRKTRKYEGEPIPTPIDEGYAKALQNIGVTFESVESYGGEDQGSTYYTIWKFERDGEFAYFQFDGYYASYNGADFNEVFEVFPREVTKIEFRR